MSFLQVFGLCVFLFLGGKICESDTFTGDGDVVAVLWTSEISAVYLSLHMYIVQR